MGLLTGPLINISTDQRATPVDSANGGIRQKFVTGTITRLVAGEIVNVYFIECDQNLWDAVGESIGRTPGVESHCTLDDYR